jgi:DNA helicase II / ATP-dependent DNA helicase PcrA
MTRARQDLHLMQPMRLFRSYQHRHGDGRFPTRRSGFIPEGILDMFERRAHGDANSYPVLATGRSLQVDVAARMREMWE